MTRGALWWLYCGRPGVDDTWRAMVAILWAPGGNFIFNMIFISYRKMTKCLLNMFTKHI